VATEKSILVKSVSSAILNIDDPFVANMRNAMNGTVVSYGIDHSADVTASDIKLDHDGRPEFTIMVESLAKERIKLPSIGRYNIYNALAAASVGTLFRIELNIIKKALESYQPMPMRMQRLVVNGVMIIDDTYNSNPVSLRSAIDLLSNIQCDGKKILVVGDMLELGRQSDELHYAVGRYISASGMIETLVTVGNKAAKVAEAALDAGMTEDRVIICKANLDAVNHLRRILGKGDTALIKGSRGMKMEEIVKGIVSSFQS